VSQSDRVLAALYDHPERGINSVDFLRFPTLDGGPPITRLAARIEELRVQGFNIESCERRERCTVYRLRPDLTLFEEAA
jgi:hypothetical protein